MDILQIVLVAFGLMALMVLVYSMVSGPSESKEVARRLQGVRYRHSESTETRVESQFKKAIAARKPRVHKANGSGSRLEVLRLRLERTGKTWQVSHYMYATLGLTLALTVIIYLKSGAALLALGIGLVIGAGVPHMVVNFLINKRLSQFTAKFPDAIELLVRGLRSGLPVTETLNVVAKEVPGPVGIEFKAVVDRVRVGRTMEDSLTVTAEKLNIPEFSFFCITLAIQRETGGNLAETLSNLADVLRKRSQMKLKIKAMSSESKASAYIVGSLPFIVFGMIWWINPHYVGGFFYEERLIITGLGGLVWMSLGVFIMAKMVSFEI
jgi:tight adherence protein B